MFSKYAQVFYVAVERKLSRGKVGHYRLYGVRAGSPVTLIMQTFNDDGEAYLWETAGAYFEMESPYPHLDSYGEE